MPEEYQSGLLYLRQVLENRLIDHALDALGYDVAIGIKFFCLTHGDAVGDHKLRLLWHVVEIPGDVGFDLIHRSQLDASGGERLPEPLPFPFVEHLKASRRHQYQAGHHLRVG